jgi:C4-dicarboxylate transporter DctM subunit
VLIATLFLLLFLFLVMGLPVSVCLGLSSLAVLLIYTDFPLLILGQKVYANIAHFTLMAVPFFLLSGALMERGGVSRRLINLANHLVGALPGGLAIAGVLASMFFASISGSSMATVAAIGSVMIPAMGAAGYDKRFAVGSMATAGTLGILIPPSIAMIVYGFVTETSVAKLFMAGFLPGIFLGAMLMLTSFVVARRRGYRTGERTSWPAKWRAFREAFWALLLPIIIIGGIYGIPVDVNLGLFRIPQGAIFTPTEAAVVSVFLALFVSIHIYKDLRWRDVPPIFIETGGRIGMLFFVVVNAVLFGFILSNEGVPQRLADWLVSLNLSPWAFLLAVNIILFFAGDFMDPVPIILVFIPVLFPAAMKLGIDPIHFGIVVVVNMEMGLITPPVGMNLYVASGISGMPLYSVMRAAAPWIAVVVFVLLVITYVPWISLVVPRLLWGP